jgi:hypothetical protein
MDHFVRCPLQHRLGLLGVPHLDGINKRGQTPWLITQGEYLAGAFIDHKETGAVLEKLGADTTLGHDINALSSVDFVVTLQRGTEWAATGEVTQKVPTTFPTAATVSYRADLAAMDAAYRLGLDALTASRR